MTSLSSKNQGAKYFLCVADVFTKYACVKSLKEKRAKVVLNGFLGIVNKSNLSQISNVNHYIKMVR